MIPRLTRPPVGEALRAALGTPRIVRRLASSPRSRVWLVEFDGTPAIVKQIAGGPDAPSRYAREVTALRLAARARPPVVPALLGTDSQVGVLVLAHLASHVPADDWAVDYARALARLHATTTAQDLGQLCRNLHLSMLQHWPGLTKDPLPTIRIHKS